MLTAMITVLQGPDSYRRIRRSQQLVAEFRALYPHASVLRVGGEDDGADERFTEFVRSASLFEPRKLLVLDPLFQDGTKALAELLRRTTEDEHCAVVVHAETAPQSPFAFLKKEGKGLVVELFPRLSGEELAAWMAAEARAQGVTLTPGAARLLSESYGSDTWSIATELQKLASYPGDRVSEEDLAALGIDAAPDFISGIRGMTAPAVGDRLAALARLLASGEPAQKLFSMLPYWWSARLDLFATYDRGVKSGKLDHEEALTDILIR
jgi:DNA polymerase III delta subunit